MAPQSMGGSAGASRVDRGRGVICSFCCQPRSRARELLMAVGITVQSLKAWVGATQALYGIDMDIAPGLATAIIGPSGCGKSTFVRCLNRMHETVPGARSEGHVRVADVDVYSR